MEIEEDASIDDIIKNIRESIVEKERQKYFASFHIAKPAEAPKEDIFELSKEMLVDKVNVPYQLGVWSFDDVAKKMLNKYKKYFKSIQQNGSDEKNSYADS